MVKFDHMSLPVADARRSRDWYVANLGFRVEFEVPDRHTVALQDDAGFTIFLYDADVPPAGARCGLTLQVDDVDDAHRRLVARGVAFEHAPQKLFWGYCAELRDPTGTSSNCGTRRQCTRTVAAEPSSA